jgi:hypothetical protein
VATARPGTRLSLAPGTYEGGLYFSSLHGAPGKPLVIGAADPKRPPVIRATGNGIQISDATYLEIRDLSFAGATGNSLNIDDGGSYAKPSHHIVLHGLTVTGARGRGNFDGIKLSGIDDLRIENCVVEQWGIDGQGIDMVGCHGVLITGCTIRHGDPEASAGVQAKGGSRDVVVRGCRFENGGARGVNIGGSTGLEFFRPPLPYGSRQAPRNYEASQILIEGNVFVGGGAPVAFVGVDGATVRFNTIYQPGRFALRILQETRSPGFVPSQNGQFTENIIAFRSNDWGEGGVNIGPDTAPKTFTFARNVWYCLDDPVRSRPDLPTPETGGLYGQDPLFRDAAHGDLRLRPGSPAARAGAEALPDNGKPAWGPDHSEPAPRGAKAGG